MLDQPRRSRGTSRRPYADLGVALLRKVFDGALPLDGPQYALGYVEVITTIADVNIIPNGAHLP